MSPETGGWNSSLVSKSLGTVRLRLYARTNGKTIRMVFQSAVAACLRWDDLLCTAPKTLVLIKDGLIGFAAKPEARGKSEGRPLGASNFAFSNENWLAGGFLLSQESTGGFARDFWIGQPLVMESEIGFPNQARAFWS